jgi:transcriptional regulator with XRE-family HTH domain
MAHGLGGFSGAALRKARQHRGLTADELGIRAGVAENTVLRWETGSSRPTAANLRKVAAVLDLTPADLLPSRIVVNPTLRDIREVAGRSMETAASESGLSRSTLARLERGLQVVSDGVVDALASLYGVTVEEVEAASAATREARDRRARAK